MHGAEDVTRAYVSDWDACLARRYATGWSERALRIVSTNVLRFEADVRLWLSSRSPVDYARSDVGLMRMTVLTLIAYMLWTPHKRYG